VAIPLKYVLFRAGGHPAHINASDFDPALHIDPSAEDADAGLEDGGEAAESKSPSAPRKRKERK
jgi:hypothetical protein